MRIVNVHQAKTHLSRLIDAAQAGETILLAKAGKPCARLMPLEAPTPQRVAGRLSRLGPLSQSDALLEPMGAEDLALWEASLLFPAPPRS
ncbi:MAG: type II toxin-antitoxin system Phd/YefM family antitoxin [Cyanobium sp.]